MASAHSCPPARLDHIRAEPPPALQAWFTSRRISEILRRQGAGLQWHVGVDARDAG